MRVIHPKYSQTGNNFMVLKQQGRLVFDIAPPSSSEYCIAALRLCIQALLSSPCSATASTSALLLSCACSSLHPLCPCPPAGGDSGRSFDWKEKVGFSLSATELAQLAAAPFSGPVRC